MADSCSNISVRQIDVLSTRGSGVLEAGSESYELDFSLHRQLSRAVVCVDQSRLGSTAFTADFFRLSGILSDQRPVSIQKLRRIGAQEGGLVELRPWNSAVEIGRRGTEAPIRSTYVLTGLYDGAFRLSLGDWGIELSSNIDAELNKKAARALHIPLEGSTLEISSDGKCDAQYERVARDLFLLLSLACGTGVSCHRWSFEYSDKSQIELWRSRAGEEVGPGPVVENSDLGEYIKQVFPVWSMMPQKEQDVFKTAITHINNSGSGYLDNRLFQVVQTWEYLAEQWIPKAGLSDAEQQLKRTLLKARRDWAKDHPTCDPDGLIGDRIAKAFEWSVLRRQIEGLAAQVGINLSILGIDVEQLKAARDSVAHSITLKNADDSSRPLFDLLLRSQYVLQIILLSKLQYKGLVIDSKNGWLIAKDIDHLSGH